MCTSSSTSYSMIRKGFPVGRAKSVSSCSPLEGRRMKTSNTWSCLLSRRCWLLSTRPSSDCGRCAEDEQIFNWGNWKDVAVPRGWLLSAKTNWNYESLHVSMSLRARLSSVPPGNMLIKFVPALECIESRQLIHWMRSASSRDELIVEECNKPLSLDLLNWIK